MSNLALQTPDDALIFFLMVALIQIGLSIVFAIKANGMAGKNYLEHGWEFSEPDSDATKTACTKWGLPQLQPQPS